jgi:membrane-bound lytic murein transglycosylase C
MTLMKKPLLLFLCLLLTPASGIGATKRINYRTQRSSTPSNPQKSAACYRSLVSQSAKHYHIDPRLIFAIIEVESHFNPRAVGLNGFGLMQIVPSTAGRDVFAHLKKRSKQPTRRYLFNPQHNIDIGTAYLHLLKTVYLAKIKDPRTRQYAMIAAYNGGHGNLFKIFSKHQQTAIQAINQLSPASFYQQIIKRHPLADTRAYLVKVTQAQSKY